MIPAISPIWKTSTMKTTARTSAGIHSTTKVGMILTGMIPTSKKNPSTTTGTMDMTTDKNPFRPGEFIRIKEGRRGSSVTAGRVYKVLPFPVGKYPASFADEFVFYEGDDGARHGYRWEHWDPAKRKLSGFGEFMKRIETEGKENVQTA